MLYSKCNNLVERGLLLLLLSRVVVEAEGVEEGPAARRFCADEAWDASIPAEPVQYERWVRE